MLENNSSTPCLSSVFSHNEPLTNVVETTPIKATKFERMAGVLLHPTSLPSGQLGKDAYAFIDFLKRAKQKLWQILPLNPVGYAYSPYQSPSAFAGNPMLISLEVLVTDGLITKDDLQAFEIAKLGKDMVEIWQLKQKILRKAYQEFIEHKEKSFDEFCQRVSIWLDDYALFMALKDYFADRSWPEWPEPIRQHYKIAVYKYREELAEDVAYYKFLQFIFYRQWLDIKAYANEHGVRIIGDMPIFIAHDSADVWANQELFMLNHEGQPEKVAGVPPDYFSETGQLWGNPHYRWDKMKEDGYQWWCNRFAILLKTVDIIRVDHFRGFESYWEVDGQAKTAIEGKWVKGPGRDFFNTLEKHFGELPIIAEDLGIITEEVNDLKDAFNFPGMKILHFELNPDNEGNVMLKCTPNSIVYTGTHDNNTTVGWLKEDASPAQIEGVDKLLHAEDLTVEEKCWKMIEYAYASKGSVVIIPMQDLLCLDSSARMNLPGTVEKNWLWKMQEGLLDETLERCLRAFCEKYNR